MLNSYIFLGCTCKYVIPFSGFGFYVYSHLQYHPIIPRRRIIISLDNELEVRCLTLWYYMYGDRPGHLYIYINNTEETEEILSYTIDTRTTEWSRFQENVYNNAQIILEHNFTNVSSGGIALDDIYISPNICSGNSFTAEILVNVNEAARNYYDNNRNVIPSVLYHHSYRRYVTECNDA